MAVSLSGGPDAAGLYVPRQGCVKRCNLVCSLVRVEFFGLLRARQAGDGLVMMNLFDGSESRELLLSAVATLRRVFPAVAVRSRPNGSHVLFAFPRERSVAWVRGRLEGADAAAPIQELARDAAAAIVGLEPPAGTPVFTDDHAPIEAMTRRMLAARRAQLP